MSSIRFDTILKVPEILCPSFPEGASPNELVDIFYSSLTPEMKATPLVYAHKLREIEPLTRNYTLFRKCYDLFVGKFGVSSPALEKPSQFIDPLTKYAIALSHEKLTLLNDSLNSLLQDATFMNNKILSPSGLNLIHQIFFTLSISHRKIDTSFIHTAIVAHAVAEERALLEKILKKCMGKLSARIGITNPNKELIKNSIKESIVYFRELEKEKKCVSINSEVDLIYNILSIPKHTRQLETQLNGCLETYSKDSCTDHPDHPLIQDFISDYSISKWPISKKLALLKLLLQTQHIKRPCVQNYPLLNISKGSIDTLCCLLPIASTFLNNPMPFHPKPIMQVEDVPSFDHPMPKASYSNPLIDVPSYLNHRFPKNLRTFFMDHSQSIEVCLGNEEEFKRIVAAKYPDYRFKAELTSVSSFHFFVYSRKDDPRAIKIFVQNITSPARLTHFAYILKHIGINLDTLTMIGSFEEIYKKERKALEDWSLQWKQQPQVLFIGTSILPYIKKRTDVIETPNNTTLCRGCYLNINGPDQKSITALSFSMPNGELSGVLTQFCLEKGVETVIMLGAGGAVKSEDFTPHISDYISFSSSYIDDQILTIPQKNLHPLIDVLLQDFAFYNKTTAHQTVSSPLLEDEAWLKDVKSKNVYLVDVETAHILKKFILHIERNPKIKILPGLFISDIVNSEEEKLEEKISSKNAFAQTPQLITRLLERLTSGKTGKG